MVLLFEITGLQLWGGESITKIIVIKCYEDFQLTGVLKKNNFLVLNSRTVHSP